MGVPAVVGAHWKMPGVHSVAPHTFAASEQAARADGWSALAASCLRPVPPITVPVTLLPVLHSFLNQYSMHMERYTNRCAAATLTFDSTTLAGTRAPHPNACLNAPLASFVDSMVLRSRLWSSKSQDDNWRHWVRHKLAAHAVWARECKQRAEQALKTQRKVESAERPNGFRQLNLRRLLTAPPPMLHGPSAAAATKLKMQRQRECDGQLARCMARQPWSDSVLGECTEQQARVVMTDVFMKLLGSAPRTLHDDRAWEKWLQNAPFAPTKCLDVVHTTALSIFCRMRLEDDTGQLLHSVGMYAISFVGFDVRNYHTGDVRFTFEWRWTMFDAPAADDTDGDMADACLFEEWVSLSHACALPSCRQLIQHITEDDLKGL